MLSTGVDLIEIERLEGAIRRHGQRFLLRIFTAAELEEVGAQPASLAARFAAKEAVAKALGCGIGDVGWLDIEVRRGWRGQPELYLHGSAAERAAQLGLHTWSLSLSHTASHAVAFVVAM